jgi:hypothetical protein
MDNVVLKKNKTRPILTSLFYLAITLTIPSCGGGGGDSSDPQDQNSDVTTQNTDFEYSFGVHPASEDGYAYARDLGIDFNRDGIYFIWDWIDPGRDGNVSFKNASTHSTTSNQGEYVNYDDNRQNLHNEVGITQMSNVCPFVGNDPSKGEFQSEGEKANYAAFIKKLVERYDGDSDLGCTMTDGVDCYSPGDNEYPTPEFISVLEQNPINYWQVCNQVTDTCNGVGCMLDNLYAQRYAEVMILTYSAVKSSCPDCQVLIAGDSAENLYPAIYSLLAGDHIDIIDKHFFGEQGEYTDIAQEMESLKGSLVTAGFDLDNLRFWITETGTYSGDPIDDRNVPEEQKLDPPFQSETDQAKELVKRYTISFGNGIEKVLWAWGIKEGFGCNCCRFDYTGLVYDGNPELQRCDDNDFHDQGNGVKKLAYYSYKLMTQKLKNTLSIETIRDSNETYIYKFKKNDGAQVYVAWSENAESVTLTGLGSDSSIVTIAVPGFEYGSIVSDFNSAFASEIKTVTGGNLDITLSEIPVYVEGYQEIHDNHLIKY